MLRLPFNFPSRLYGKSFSNHKFFSQMMYYIETRLLAKKFTVWGQVYMERRKDFIPEWMFVIVDVCFDDGFRAELRDARPKRARKN